MPERVAGNSVLRSSLSLSDPSTSFVFIRTLARYGETIGAASRCDGFPIASSTTSATMNFGRGYRPSQAEARLLGGSNVSQVTTRSE